MDKKITKSQRNIKTAYLQLRTKNDISKIKVTHLCELADINKSTFYKYYTDIYQLNETLEDQIVDDIMDDFSEIDLLFCNPKEFLTGMTNAVSKHEPDIMIVFNNHFDVLITKLETRIKKAYHEENASCEQDLLISFLIGGAAHATLQSPSYDYANLNKIIERILENISM